MTPPPPPDDALARLHRDLGFADLSPWWAKLEILVGLVAIAVGFTGIVRLAVVEAKNVGDIYTTSWAGQAALIVLGGYLALAGHRSQLYQSNNRLAAYLAELIRAKPRPPETSP